MGLHAVVMSVGERCPLVSSEVLLTGTGWKSAFGFALCFGPHLQGTLAFPENASQKQADLTLLSTHPESCPGCGTLCSGHLGKGWPGGLCSSLWADEGQPWALLSPQGTSPLHSLRVPSRLPEDDDKQDQQVSSVGNRVYS